MIAVTIGRLVGGQAGSGTASIGLRENFVELRVTAESCRIDSFCQSLLFRLTILLPETRESQRIPVPAQWNTDLTSKCAAKVRFAHSTGSRELAEIPAPAVFAQESECAPHRRMQSYGIT